MKYIILEDFNGRRYPIIFPELMVHSDTAEFVRAQLLKKHQLRAGVVSAGFIGLGTDLITHGMSESLGVSSRPIDTAIIGLSDSGASLSEEMLEGLWQKVREVKK